MPEMSVSQAELEDLHLEAAADWFVSLSEEGSAEARRRWQAWHDAAPAHRQAWEKVERLQSLLAGVPLQASHLLRQPARQPVRKSRRQLMSFVGVAIAAGMGSVFLPTAPERPATRWIATARGERRTVTLPDGGRVWLGSGTRMGVAYDGQHRDIYLAQGALQLSSGSDARRRPLRILSRDGVVRPLGTRLTVTQFAAHTVLAVQEHAAEVLTHHDQHGPAVRLKAGQRVRFTATDCGRVQAAAFGDDAWTRGLLMAMDLPLPEFAAQFALYSGQVIEVAPALAGRRVSGTYQIDAPVRSLQTLADVLAIRAERTGSGWRLRP